MLSFLPRSSTSTRTITDRVARDDHDDGALFAAVLSAKRHCRGMSHGPETPSVATSSSGMRYVGLGAVALVAITALGAARHAVVLESGGASRVQRDRFFDRMTSNDLKLHAQHVARGRGAVFFKRELAKTAAERLVAAKRAAAFDRRTAKLNAEIFPAKATKTSWKAMSSSAITEHLERLSADVLGKGGDELMRKHAFASSPRPVPAHGGAAAREEEARTATEERTAAEQAAAQIAHIRAVTEETFPKLVKKKPARPTLSTGRMFPKRFRLQEAKAKHLQAQTAAQLSAEHRADVNAEFPKRFATQEAKGRFLAARTSKSVAKARQDIVPRRGQGLKKGAKAWPTSKAGPLSSDVPVPSAGTNVVFQGANQAGDGTLSHKVRNGKE